MLIERIERISEFMKLETFIILAKLFCVCAGTGFLTLQTGLGQWSNSDKGPSTTQWVMIIGGSVGTGLTASGAFLSNAFGTYLTGRNNSNGTQSGSRPLNGPEVIGKIEMDDAKKKNTDPLTTPNPSAILQS